MKFQRSTNARRADVESVSEKRSSKDLSAPSRPVAETRGGQSVSGANGAAGLTGGVSATEPAGIRAAMHLRIPGMRWLAPGVGALGLWQGVVWFSGVPPYILPAPQQVAQALFEHAGLIGSHMLITVTEILLGLILGTIMGVLSAITIVHFRAARFWLMPILVASQAIPVFALAPVLVLWIGYGMASKVAMAILIIFFPVTAAFLDGLRRTEPGWVDLARTMTGDHFDRMPGWRARLRILIHVRVPAALPSLGSGIRVAAAVAPIGAVVGEWVGSSAGLGYLMLHANGRMQIDLMFAALFALAVFSVALWHVTDYLLLRLVPWQPDVFRNRGEKRS